MANAEQWAEEDLIEMYSEMILVPYILTLFTYHWFLFGNTIIDWNITVIYVLFFGQR